MPRILRHYNWQDWLYGMWVASIGGGANSASGSLAVLVIDPKDFGLGTSNFWKVASVMFATGAAVGFFSFLKANPAPKIVEEEVV